MKVPKFIKDWLTEDDAGEIWSLVHAMAACGFLAFIGMSIYAVWKSGHFDPQAYGLGLTGVMGGSGAAILANSKSGTKPNV